MTPVLDKSNYGGLPGRGTDHYLVNLIHNVLKNHDNNKREGPRAAIAAKNINMRVFLCFFINIIFCWTRSEPAL